MYGVFADGVSWYCRLKPLHTIFINFILFSPIKTPIMRHLKLLILLIATSATSKAQIFGGNPPSVKWEQVNTPTARIIFPAGLDSAGVRIANIVNQMNRAVQPTIGLKQKQVDILVQNQNTESNAFVQLAPFKSEFYFTPPQNSFNLGSLHWVDQLAVHEFRHVQQFNNFDVGIIRAIHAIFGEGGQALFTSIAIPNWFFEGDAVFNETYVTTQGRGRLPYFFDGYRALWSAGRNYSWMKLRNGSYQDYVPNHYPLGYMMVAYGREKYGDDFWKNVTHDAASYNGIFYPLQNAIRKHSGVDFEKFRTDAFDHFKKQANPPAEPAPKNQHFIADMEYPAYVDDNTLVYAKTTYDKVTSFYTKTNGVEKKIRTFDYTLDNYFAYHDGKIIYASYRPDLRWGYRTYNEINIVDIKTGEETNVTSGTKYFSPSFSDDGKSIVAVQQGSDGKSQLHVLDLNGKVIAAIPNKDNLLYSYPKFYGNKVLSAVRNTAGKMSIALTDVNTGNNEDLLPFSIQPIAFPSVVKEKVYFSATSDKNDALFVLSLSDKKLYQLQSDSLKNSIGNYEVAASGNKLAWVSFTAFGFKLHELDNSKVEWRELPTATIPGSLPEYGISALDKGNATDMLATVKDEPQTVTKYNKAFHLFNFHSLQPTISDPNYSISLLGENVLNTLQTEVLFNYNRNEGYKEVGAGVVYGALFPFLSVGADYVFDRTINYTVGSSPTVNTGYYNETLLHAGLQFPFNFTKGHTVTTLSAGSQLVYDLTSYQSPLSSLVADRNYMYVTNFLVFSTHGRQAHKNLYPHLGESLNLNYETAITNISGYQGLAINTFYLPGLMANHGLIIQGAFQQRDKRNGANFSNNFPTPRGYGGSNLYQQYKASASYNFPIFYPDAGIANALYFLRVRGNVFYDHGFGVDSKENSAKFRSMGSEVFFDTQIFNEYPVSIGVRYSHLIDRDVFGGHGPNRIEIVLPLTIF